MKNGESRAIDIFHDNRNVGTENFEFLIRRSQRFEFSDEFEIPENSYEEIFTPNNIPFTEFNLLEYEYCEYKVLNTKVSIVGEFAGIQIVVENNGIQRELVKNIIREIRDNIQKITNHTAQILEV